MSQLELRSFLTGIVAVAASAVSITIALSILVLNLSTRILPPQVVPRLWRDSPVGKIILLFTLTIFVGLVGLLITKESIVTPLTLLIAVAAFALLVASFVFLFRNWHRLFRLVSPVAQITRIASAINLDYWSQIRNSISRTETDPLLVLEFTAVRAIREHDSVSSDLAINGVTNSVRKLLKTAGPFERRDIIEFFLQFYERVSAYTIQERKPTSSKLLLKSLHSVAQLTYENNFKWPVRLELIRTIENMGLISAELRQEEVVDECIRILGALAIQALEMDCPKESDLILVQLKAGKQAVKKMDNRSEEDLRWWHNAKDYIRRIYSIGEKALNSGMSRTVWEVRFYYGEILRKIDEDKFGELQKEEIYSMVFAYLEALLFSAVELGVWNECLGSSQIDSSLFIFTNENRKLGKIIIDSEIRSFLHAARKGVISSYELNVLGGLGRVCIDKWPSAAIVAAEALGQIARIAEMNLGLSNWSWIYLEAAKQIESIRDWQMHKVTTIVEACNKVLNTMSKIDQVKVEVEKEQIHWPHEPNNPEQSQPS